MTGVLVRRGKVGHRHTERRRPREDGDRHTVMYLEAKDHQRLLAAPEAGRGAWTRLSLIASRRNQPC